MPKITCYDYDGDPHEVDASQIKRRVSAYGIYIKDNKIVLTNDIGTDRWDLPGGGVEEGENIEEGLRREFVEETGMEIAGEVFPFKVIREYYMSGRGEPWDSERHYFLVTNAKGEIKADINMYGTAGAKWVNFGELDNFNINAKVRQLILDSK